MLIKKYLQRMDINSTIKVDLKTLALIQKQHLLTVPFENIDIHLNKPIKTDFDSLFEKIVIQRRGGICYELNGLLYFILKKIGFTVRTLGAKVEKEGTYFDHILLVVTIGFKEYLVDVGFGNNFLEPLEFKSNAIQNDVKGLFRVSKVDVMHYELSKFSEKTNNFEVEYIFKNEPKTVKNFKDRMNYYVYNDHSIFKKNLFCSLELELGRISLKQDKFLVTLENNRSVLEVKSNYQFIKLLDEKFNIHLDFNQIEKINEYWQY